MFEVKNVFIGALLILNKFTIFNIKFYSETDDMDYSFGVFLLPILGLLIGFATIIISLLKFLYDPMFIGALLLTFYFVITKSVNITSTYKTIETFIQQKNKNSQLLSIISLMIICIFYFVMFSVLSARAIILMPLVGYSNLLILSYFIKRNKENTQLLKYCTKSHSIFAFLFSFIITIIISYKSTIALSLTYILSAIAMNFIDAKIKKLPSSIEGFIIEITQLLFLLLSYLLFI